MKGKTALALCGIVVAIVAGVLWTRPAGKNILTFQIGFRENLSLRPIYIPDSFWVTIIAPPTDRNVEALVSDALETKQMRYKDLLVLLESAAKLQKGRVHIPNEQARIEAPKGDYLLIALTKSAVILKRIALFDGAEVIIDDGDVVFQPEDVTGR